MTLEQIKAMAQRDANKAKKPMAVLNLNMFSALYVVRDYDPRMQEGPDAHQFIAKFEPEA